MRILISLAATSAMALSLAACGSGADDAADQPGEDVSAADDMGGPMMDEGDPGAADDAGAEDGEDAGEDGEEDGEQPDPAASASPTPSAAPTQAAATPPPMFAVCSACHSVKPGENGIGPTLAGVFGAQAGRVSGFGYSDAMAGSGLTWDEATLNRYLENPSAVVPGTSMSYNGLKNPDQRKAVIDYLKTL